MVPDIDSGMTAAAGGGAIGLTFLAALMKIIRDKKTGDQSVAATDIVNSGNQALMEQFLKEIARQNALINDLSVKIEALRKENTDLAVENARLAARITTLETDLTHVRPEMNIPLTNLGAGHGDTPSS
jgi:predicted RNase H-like nuclease (RuvC/YqgF family)